VLVWVIGLWVDPNVLIILVVTSLFGLWRLSYWTIFSLRVILKMGLWNLFATQFHDVVFNTLEGGSISEPLRLDPMDALQALVALKLLHNIGIIGAQNARLNECIQHNEPFLIDDGDLAWNIHAASSETKFRS
jgi:hypothetical protein